MAVIELSMRFRQSIKRRIPDGQTLRREVQTRVYYHNPKLVKVDWRFSAADSHIKLKRYNLSFMIDGLLSSA